MFPRVIGHRGVPRRAPENSLAGFALAGRLGVPWVELDVQLSRDLQPVVFHDDRLERCSNGQGRLIDQDVASLHSLDIGSWFAADFAGERLPLWSEVLDILIAARLGVNIEVKAEDSRAEITAEIAIRTAQAVWPREAPPPLVTSFALNALPVAAKWAPDWPRGIVSDHWSEALLAQAAAFGCASLHLRADAITPERVTAAQAQGLAVLAYVVDDPVQAHQLWQWGVDGVFSDEADRLT